MIARGDVEGEEAAWTFCYPLDPSKLRNDKLRLVPFDSHLDIFSQHYVRHTSTPSAAPNFRYLSYGPFQTVSDFREWYTRVIESSNSVVWFAVIVTAAGTEEVQRQRRESGTADERPDDTMRVRMQADSDGIEEFFAGSISLLNAVADHAVCEIGHINILPSFQRTFVNTHANALLLHYLLDPPLGLRRVTWLANARNERSVRAAQRLGFRLEGISRWCRILPKGKEGDEAEIDGASDGRGPARDTATLSICWDDWKDGVRERLDALILK